MSLNNLATHQIISFISLPLTSKQDVSLLINVNKKKEKKKMARKCFFSRIFAQIHSKTLQMIQFITYLSNMYFLCHLLLKSENVVFSEFQKPS